MSAAESYAYDDPESNEGHIAHLPPLDADDDAWLESDFDDNWNEDFEDELEDDYVYADHLDEQLESYLLNQDAAGPAGEEAAEDADTDDADADSLDLDAIDEDADILPLDE